MYINCTYMAMTFLLILTKSRPTSMQKLESVRILGIVKLDYSNSLGHPLAIEISEVSYTKPYTSVLYIIIIENPMVNSLTMALEKWYFLVHVCHFLQSFRQNPVMYWHSYICICGIS